MNSSLSAQNSTTTSMGPFFHAFLKNCFLVVLGFSINYVNGTLVLTFFRNQVLSEDPRYILYIHMVIADIVQLSLAIALHVVSYALPAINVAVCCCLVLVGSFTTMTTPLNLAGMAVERYGAVCDPLRHAQICTVRRTYALVALIWGVGMVPGLADLALGFRFRPPSSFRSTIMCYHGVFYSPSQAVTKPRGATRSACFSKARNTILLHGAQLLLCMLAYVTPVVDLMVIVHYPQLITHILFLTFLISYVLPRILSPLIYGLRDKFWKYTIEYWCCVHHRKVKTDLKVTKTMK
ncbi:hypothetical protein SKAU_G00424950 [Synaphobranchus kaupii]|uniref:G-protein coupled receptors family 1 profile domain-containing protein n=1 Tax=Synaphobranchus kaupii TaxID=118154 RepID=A0A9Q1E5N9_SYNKA|nr:hypothetical protein SKAU_G00424950 [Synaphobranchus kaupii]